MGEKKIRNKGIREEDKKNGRRATPGGVGEKKNGDEPEWKKRRRHGKPEKEE